MDKMNSASKKTLSIKTKLFYGMGDIGNAIANTAVIYFLLIFYTDAAMVPPALAGTALLIGKIWDAVNDPLFGWISDRVNPPRFGRRRFFMIIGALPLAVALALLWIVPTGLTNVWLFVWIVITFILFDTFITFTSVPYYAMTAELTDDYDERSSLTAFRMLMGIPAYMIGAAATPALVALFIIPRTGYAWTGLIYGIIAAISLLVCAAGIKEKPTIKTANEFRLPPFQALKLVLQNKPFVQLILAYMIANFGFVLIRTMLAYFLTYQLGMKDQVPIVMLLLLVSVLIFIFPWKILSEKWNKGPAYALGLGIGALSVVGSFFLPNHPTPAIYIIAVIAGMGFSANWIFPWSMVPDVVEYDEVITGEKRGGIFYGIWGFAFKLTNALGVAVAGWVLQIFHYQANIQQTSQTLLGIRLFIGPAPAIIILLCLPLLIYYPVTRAKHAEIKQRLVKLAD